MGSPYLLGWAGVCRANREIPDFEVQVVCRAPVEGSSVVFSDLGGEWGQGDQTPGLAALHCGFSHCEAFRAVCVHFDEPIPIRLDGIEERPGDECVLEPVTGHPGRAHWLPSLPWQRLCYSKGIMPRRYLVTGGAGFIGSNFVRFVLEREPEASVINLDSLTYAGVQATVDELNESPRHTFARGDIRDGGLVDDVVSGVDVVVNFAAESHVDRSIEGPSVFLETNVVGTGNLIDAARRHDVSRFVQVSTDEVYGSIADGFAPEGASLEPSSPYSASKAGADLLVQSYEVTFDYPAIITRCTNNYGPYQFPEKMIPLFVTNLLDGKKVPVYGDGLNERDWLYVEDHCAAIHLLVDEGTPGEVYNIGANAQVSNLELTKRLLEATGRDESFIEFVPDRPGHDRRYAVDSSKIRSLGWAPDHTLAERLVDTIEWYKNRSDWWQPLKAGR